MIRTPVRIRRIQKVSGIIGIPVIINGPRTPQILLILMIPRILDILKIETA